MLWSPAAAATKIEAAQGSEGCRYPSRGLGGDRPGGRGGVIFGPRAQRRPLAVPLHSLRRGPSAVGRQRRTRARALLHNSRRRVLASRCAIALMRQQHGLSLLRPLAPKRRMLRFTRRATTQLERLLNDLALISPQAAVSVSDRLVGITDMLLQFPRTGRRTARRIVRRITMVPLPYNVDYRVDDQEVVILGVRHAKRRPLP